MTNLQLYLAIGVPILFNTITTILLVMLVTNLSRRMTEGFAAINQRFDDMRALWQAELHRVEGILDARLTHLEDQRS